MYILEYLKFKERKDSLSGIALIVEGRICLVLPKKFKKQNKYSIPKGHIEADKTPFYNAHRELKEETGIDIGLKQHSNSFKYTYKKNGIKKDMMVYVVEMTAEEFSEISIGERNKSEITKVKFYTREKALNKVEPHFKKLIRYLLK